MSAELPNDSCPSDHKSRRWSHDDNQTHSPSGRRVRETDVSTTHVVMCQSIPGNLCAGPPDWANHPVLKIVAPQDRRAFREMKIAEWLEAHVRRGPCEYFHDYLSRCIASAAQELKKHRKVHIGDDYLHHLDKLVFKLFYGSRIAQSVLGTRWSSETEELVLQLLREECADLVGQGLLKLDPKKLFAPATLPWPDSEDTNLYTAQKIPTRVMNLAEMDFR